MEDFKDFMIAERHQESLIEAQADYKKVLLQSQLDEIKEEYLQANNEGDKCSMCGNHKGEIPICEEDSNRTLWICEYCDSEMFDNSLESKGLVEQEITI